MALSSPACMAGRAGDRSYPCPCCGHLVFGEPPGSYEICPVCFWEDDALQLEYATTLGGGANVETLLDAQRNFASFGACEHRSAPYVRPPTPGEMRDPRWRPIDVSRDRFPRWQSDDPTARRSEHVLYYWLPTYWYANLHTPGGA